MELMVHSTKYPLGFLPLSVGLRGVKVRFGQVRVGPTRRDELEEEFAAVPG